MADTKKAKNDVKAILAEIKEKGFNDERKEKLIRSLNKTGLKRTFEVREDQIDKENRIIKGLAISSDAPYERWFGIEILDHKAESVVLDRINNEAPFLYQHDPDRDIGTILKGSATIDGGKMLRVDVKFQDPEYNEDAKKVWNAILDGHRKKISVGYMIHELVLEKQSDEGPDEYRVTKWEPMEASSVSIPADDTVGVGRENDMHQSDEELLAMIKKANENSQIKIVIENQNQKNGGNSMEPKEPKAAEPQVNTEEIRKAERDRVNSITSLAKLNNLDSDPKVKEAIDEGWSLDRFVAHVTDTVQNIQVNKRSDELDMPKKDVEDYDLMAAVKYLVDPSGCDKETRKRAGVAIEASNAVAQKTGKTPQGLFVPYDLMVGKRIKPRAQRDLSAGGTGTGAELVGTDHLGSELIELLRNRTLAFSLGARMMSGLQGDVTIPKWSGAATYYWITTEGDSVTESTPSTGSISLSPKNGGGSVDITRQLQLQSTPDASNLVWDDLMNVCAIGLDLAVFHGTGANGQPTGIALTSGIGAVAGASYTWAKAVEHESDVDTANALMDSFAYVTTPSIRGTLKAREKVSNTAKFICEDNMVNGYPMLTTNQVSAGYIFFGNFAQVIVGDWGGLDLYPTKLERSGTIVLTALQSVDVGVRQPGAFSVATSFS